MVEFDLSLIEEMRDSKGCITMLVKQGVDDDTMKSLFMGNMFEILNELTDYKKKMKNF